MTDFNLDRDEAIVLESDEVLRLKQDGDYDELDHVVLTNKRLYGSYEKSIGLFKKSSTEIYTWPLSDIKIINGQAQVQQVTYTGELCLRIQFMKETVYLAFSDDPEETMLQWILEINKLLGSTAIIPPPKPPKEKKHLFARKRTDPADNLKKVIPAADEPAPKPSVEKVHTVAPDHTDDSQLASQPKQTKTAQSSKDRFCMNCGNKLSPGTIFCPVCGFKVTSTKDSAIAEPTLPTPPTSSVPPAPSTGEKVNRVVKPEKAEEKHDSDKDEKPTGIYTQRQQEYVGKVLKCPSCGEVLDSFKTHCPSCGYEIRNTRAVSAAQELAKKLEIIEAQKMPVVSIDPTTPFTVSDPLENEPNSIMKNLFGWDFNERKRVAAAEKAIETQREIRDQELKAKIIDVRIKEEKFEAQKNQEKASLIQNFPIPNTKEDILEFALLVSTNINTKNAMPDIVAKAWMAKLGQVYQKANISLNNNSDLKEIENIYQQVNKRWKVIYIIYILKKTITVFLGLVTSLVAFLIDGLGGNCTFVAVISAILLIVSAVLLRKRKTTFIEFVAVALSGIFLFNIARTMENGEILIIAGIVVFIITVVNFAKAVKEQSL